MTKRMLISSHWYDVTYDNEGRIASIQYVSD